MPSPSSAIGTSPDPSTLAASPDALQDVATASGTAGPVESPDPAAAVATSQVDLTPIVLAILGAGLLIAAGIAVAGYELRRRNRQPEAGGGGGDDTTGG